MSGNNRVITAVHTLARALTASHDLDAALKAALHIAVEVGDAEGGSILLHDPASRQLMFRHVLGNGPDNRPAPVNFAMLSEAISDSEGIAGHVFQTRTPLICNDVATNPTHARRIDDTHQFDTRSLATVPLCFPEGEAVGVLQLVNKLNGEFGEEDLTVLSVVASITTLAIALRNQTTV